MLVIQEQSELRDLTQSAIAVQLDMWRLELSNRLSNFEAARQHSREDFDYGGAAAMSINTAPLQQAVNEAKGVVAIISAELREREEGSAGCVRVIEEQRARYNFAGV